eukprot:TRINITY_DN5216_c0_g1_i2.p1 TRINITY_DN5216_c0_g1~~TRINITY_DN5216_c0_g1_i2.p1  ORF type:complete len:182 (+),score=5.67 TRINITY_DN5216_c0_g1_i2:150-695(+)
MPRIQAYHSESQEVDIRPFYIYINFIMYFTSIGLMIGDLVIYQDLTNQQVPSPTNILQTVLFVFDGSVYLLASLGFIVYGGRFYYRFAVGKHRPLLGKTRQDILPRVKTLTLLCGLCFTIRGTLTLWDTLADWPAAVFWWVDIVYYTTLEILPLVSMLFIFRPNKQAEKGIVHTRVINYSA